MRHSIAFVFLFLLSACSELAREPKPHEPLCMLTSVPYIKIPVLLQDCEEHENETWVVYSNGKTAIDERVPTDPNYAGPELEYREGQRLFLNALDEDGRRVSAFELEVYVVSENKTRQLKNQNEGLTLIATGSVKVPNWQYSGGCGPMPPMSVVYGPSCASLLH
jgi:hypothetical protein